MGWGIPFWGQVPDQTPDTSKNEPQRVADPIGIGVAAVAQVNNDNDVAVDEVASIVLKYPAERDAIFRWLHEHRGNRFVQEVMAKTSAQPKQTAMPDPRAPQQEPQKPAPQVSGPVNVGDQYIDQGPVCGTGDGCFLEDGQRSRLIGSYQNRVQTAEQAYRGALGELRVDELFKKLENDQKSNLPWIMSLAFDLIGAQALKALTKALEGLIHMERENLALVYNAATAGGRAEKIAQKMADSLGKITPAQLTKLSKTAADAATKKTKAAVTRAIKDGSVAVQNQIDTNYLDYLMDNASSTFQALREGPPGFADDAQLMTLWQGYDGQNHTVSHYKAELTDKLARFHTSGVMDVGREMRVVGYEEETQIEGQTTSSIPVDRRPEYEATRDRTVVQLQFLSGRAPQYATAHRDFQVEGIAVADDPRGKPKTEGVYQQLDADHQGHAHEGTYVTPFRDTQVSQRDPGGKSAHTVHVQREFHLEKLIEPEFEEIAIERHNVQWRMAPRTILIDDRQAQREAGAPMPEGYKPQGNYNYVVIPSGAYKADDPTTWWGFKEHKAIGYADQKKY